MVTVEMSVLGRLADELGVKVEIDAEGSIVVTPAADSHVVAQSDLLVQIAAALPSHLVVVTEGPRWAPLGGDKPSYIPDVGVAWRTALHRRPDEYSLSPPPVLVVEVLSPETRRRDLTEKADGYFTGGADAYWTIEVPELAPVDRPTLVHRRRGATGWVASGPVTGHLDLDGPIRVALDLDRLQV